MLRHSLLSLLLLAFCNVERAAADVLDRVLAVVDGHLPPLSDVRTAVELRLVTSDTSASDPTDAVLSQLIDRRLVLEEVDRYAPPEPDAAAVAMRVAAVERQSGPPNGIAARLASLGVDAEWLQQWMRDDLRIQSYIEQRFAGSMEASDEEIENYFRVHADAFMRGDQPIPAAEAQQLARARIAAARRRALTDEWLNGLRKRAEITRPAAR
jgi:hypothetical protein